MPKTIISPVKRFPGTVTIPDFLTIPQAQVWEQSLRAVKALESTHNVADIEYIEAWQSGVMGVVSQWDLERFSADPFQTTPRLDVIRLITWIVNEITALYWEAEEVPNE